MTGAVLANSGGTPYFSHSRSEYGERLMFVDVIVDTVCPWCYVGKARFEKALAMRPDQPVEIGWRPFQLNPGIPPGGKNRRAYLTEKFGGGDRAERRYSVIGDAGRQEGIEFRFDLIERTPNTVDSHRLIAFARRDGREHGVVDALFRAYFTEGRDIGKISILSEIAAENGLDGDAARRFLESDEDRALILGEDELARSLGVNGVPCYIVDRKYAISGAQSPEVFLQIFDLGRHEGRQIAAE
jgi:predicted DsbA family dithiol-disulfide isomerase